MSKSIENQPEIGRKRSKMNRKRQQTANRPKMKESRPTSAENYQKMSKLRQIRVSAYIVEVSARYFPLLSWFEAIQWETMVISWYELNTIFPAWAARRKQY